MSTPPDQPSASPQSDSADESASSPVPPPPGPGAGQAPGDQTPIGQAPIGQAPIGQAPGGYGAPSAYATPVPAQYNPYAQPVPYGPQAYAAPAGVPQPPSGRRGGAGRAVLWGVVGAVLASALWGGGVLLLRGSGTKADLRGYTVKSDLCDTADVSAFKPGFTPSDSHTAWSAKGDSIGQMLCNESMDEPAGSGSASDAYLEIYVELNHKTDPKPEFSGIWLGYRQHKDEKYTVTPVSGFGDEAYLVTADSLTGSSTNSGERYVTLALRDGWMTYYMTWTQYTSFSSSDSGSADLSSVATVDQVAGWVKASTTATLAKLKG